MGIYYVQKKDRMDKNGVEHLNYNVTIPYDAVNGMGLDSKTREDRAVDVSYDKATQTITITKAKKAV